MMMRNCKRCGKAYNSTNPSICPECIERDRENFETVRNFIKDNPNVSVEVVEEATGVDAETIREYLRQGRIESKELSGPMLECERCGKPIYSGKYCVVCQAELRNTFRSGFRSESSKPSGSSEKKRKGSFVRNYRNKS